jgi:hypothetical protein
MTSHISDNGLVLKTLGALFGSKFVIVFVFITNSYANLGEKT